MTAIFDKNLALLPPLVSEHFRLFWKHFANEPQASTLLQEPLFVQSAAKVVGISEFLAQSILKTPELLVDLFVSGDLIRAQNEKYYQRQFQNFCAAVQDKKQLAKQLRLLRQREMMRIAWRDLAGWAELSESLYELTVLADTLVAETSTKLCQWLEEIYGQAINAQGQATEFIILALGKLGGGELNFSSDIDLLFAFSESGQTNGPRSLTNEQFYIKLGRDLLTMLNDVTQDGFVYRVDLRLRPYGDSGPLVISLRALEEYYQLQGRDWERYALVKARVIAGSEQSRQQVQAIIQPFVYRRYVDYSVIASLRELKNTLDRETKRLQLQDNIKRGPGGIREIEFIAQAFQIIRGGKESFLQQRNLLSALNSIGLIEELPKTLVSELSTAYRFLRKLENRLQILNDRQTQKLPTQDRQQQALAAAMNYKTWDDVLQQLNIYREQVKAHFDNMITSREQKPAQAMGFSQLTDLIRRECSDEHGRQILDSIPGVEEPDELLAVIKTMKCSAKIKAASTRAKERLNQFVPRLLDKLVTKKQAAEILKRIVPIIESIAKRSAYVALLLENPIALDNLIYYCSLSPWIAKKMENYPLLLDELLVTYKSKPMIKEEDLVDELKHMLLSVPQEDLESQLEFMRQFKHTHEVRAAIYELLNLLSVEEISDYLSMLAQVLVQQAYLIALNHLQEKHGLVSSKFMVIAYGKLGSKELSYESDLDLVFLHDGETQCQTDGQRPISYGEFFVRLGQRIMNILNVRTTSGVLYPVDVRLRPSGTAGMLVSSFASYADYQRQKAWTWEHQALVRARPIIGPANLIEDFKTLRQEVLQWQRDEFALKQDIASMREKMLSHKKTSQLIDIKRDSGGIIDVEFLVQYFMLAFAVRYPELSLYYHHLTILQALIKIGIISELDGQTLIDAYLSYHRTMHQQTLLGYSDMSKEQWQEYKASVVKIWEKFINGAKKEQA